TCYVQPMAAEQGTQGRDREITQVLVVDRIELSMLDEILDVRALDDGDSVILQKCCNARDEAVGVGYVGQDVVRVDHIGPAALGNQILGEVVAEERLESLYSLQIGRA